MALPPLPRISTTCKLIPTDEVIASDVDPQTGWIPLKKIYIEERIGKGGINLRPEEIPFIHPRDICILRIKHQMAQDGITGASREGIMRLYTIPLDEIDRLFPEIVNPNGGGYSNHYLTSYKTDPDFFAPAAKHREALKIMNEILGDHNYPQVWIGNVPYMKPDSTAFGKNDIREVITKHTGIDPAKIMLIKLAPPTRYIGIHGGNGTLYIQDEETAKRLKSFDRKIPVPSKTKDGIKDLLLVLRDPLEKYAESKKPAPQKKDSMW